MSEPVRFLLIIGAAIVHPPTKISGFNRDVPRRQCEMSVTVIFELLCFIKSIDFSLSHCQHSGRIHTPYAVQ